MIQIQTTVATQKDAGMIAEELVNRRLAACVQVLGPVTSTYRWRGEIKITEEWLCLIKTRTDLYSRIESAILEIHPYETPEIIAVPIERSSPDYLSWVQSETAGE